MHICIDFVFYCAKSAARRHTRINQQHKTPKSIVKAFHAQIDKATPLFVPIDSTGGEGIERVVGNSKGHPTMLHSTCEGTNRKG